MSDTAMNAKDMPKFGTPEWDAAFRRMADAVFLNMATAVVTFSDQLAQTSVTFGQAVTSMNVAVNEMRREHPEWFDPHTGYFLADDV